MELKQIKCIRCGYQWYPNPPKCNPKECPACKSYKYNIPRKRRSLKGLRDRIPVPPKEDAQ